VPAQPPQARPRPDARGRHGRRAITIPPRIFKKIRLNRSPDRMAGKISQAQRNRIPILKLQSRSRSRSKTVPEKPVTDFHLITGSRFSRLNRSTNVFSRAFFFRWPAGDRKKFRCTPSPRIPRPIDLRAPPSETASRETWKCPWETEPAASPVVPLFPQPTGTGGNDSQKQGNTARNLQGFADGKM
jgi:hypothetical protein